jgi:hypothetical protein
MSPRPVVDVTCKHVGPPYKKCAVERICAKAGGLIPACWLDVLDRKYVKQESHYRQSTTTSKEEKEESIWKRELAVPKCARDEREREVRTPLQRRQKV